MPGPRPADEHDVRILLTPFGSRGDVQSMLALGLGLREEGHDVAVATAVSYRSWIEGFGLPFSEIGGDVETWVREEAGGTRNPLALYRSLARYMREELSRCFSQSGDAILGADLVITTLHPAARSVSEAARIPCRTVVLMPQLLPSRYHPPLLFPWSAPPVRANPVLWWVTAKAPRARHARGYPLGAYRARPRRRMDVGGGQWILDLATLDDDGAVEGMDNVWATLLDRYPYLVTDVPDDEPAPRPPPSGGRARKRPDSTRTTDNVKLKEPFPALKGRR